MNELDFDRSPPGEVLPNLLEIDEVTELLRISRSLLAKWRMAGRGPRFMKVGRRILYDCGEVRRWLAAQQRSSTLDQVL